MCCIVNFISWWPSQSCTMALNCDHLLFQWYLFPSTIRISSACHISCNFFDSSARLLFITPSLQILYSKVNEEGKASLFCWSFVGSYKRLNQRQNAPYSQPLLFSSLPPLIGGCVVSWDEIPKVNDCPSWQPYPLQHQNVVLVWSSTSRSLW